MPNWCSNYTKIYHEDSTKIDAIEQELIKKESQLFNMLFPRPADEEENWYGWNVNNWGTKWDASVYDWEREDANTIAVNYDTAWAPALGLLEHLCNNDYSVTSYYHEPGMAFIGYFEDGHDDFYEYDITDAACIEDIPEHIVDYGNLMEEHENWVAENDDSDEPEEDIQNDCECPECAWVGTTFDVLTIEGQMCCPDCHTPVDYDGE